MELLGAEEKRDVFVVWRERRVIFAAVLVVQERKLLYVGNVYAKPNPAQSRQTLSTPKT